MKKTKVKEINGAEKLKKLRLSRETLKILTQVVGGSACSHSPRVCFDTDDPSNLCGTTYGTT